MLEINQAGYSGTWLLVQLHGRWRWEDREASLAKELARLFLKKQAGYGGPYLETQLGRGEGRRKGVKASLGKMCKTLPENK
jgi:hypothetical protein